MAGPRERGAAAAPRAAIGAATRAAIRADRIDRYHRAAPDPTAGRAPPHPEPAGPDQRRVPAWLGPAERAGQPRLVEAAGAPPATEQPAARAGSPGQRKGHRA